MVPLNFEAMKDPNPNLQVGDLVGGPPPTPMTTTDHPSEIQNLPPTSMALLFVFCPISLIISRNIQASGVM